MVAGVVSCVKSVCEALVVLVCSTVGGLWRSWGVLFGCGGGVRVLRGARGWRGGRWCFGCERGGVGQSRSRDRPCLGRLAAFATSCKRTRRREICTCNNHPRRCTATDSAQVRCSRKAARCPNTATAPGSTCSTTLHEDLSSTRPPSGQGMRRACGYSGGLRPREGSMACYPCP